MDLHELNPESFIRQATLARVANANSWKHFVVSVTLPPNLEVRGADIDKLVNGIERLHPAKPRAYCFRAGDRKWMAVNNGPERIFALEWRMDLVQLGLSFAKVGALETRAWLQRTLDHLARAAEGLAQLTGR
jgi:hypothetical protein